ncbi:MAG: exodeoxyribonuclease V subunit beta [Balneolaceae bacterium]|nr:exodeoxyribonuclease V subunit beta [Balneolaceae bacterium]
MKSIDSMYDLQWSPRILIEASAGTGKTYTLTALYVRLLIEKKLEVDQILVMTFTNKATSELKERIFKRLKSCLLKLQTNEESSDDFVNELMKKISNPVEAIQILKNAIQNFDDSQVYTIHGFCQKVLKEEALIAQTPFEFEINQQDELLQQATEDFWRNFMNSYSDSEAGRYYISKLLDIADSPKKLRDQLSLVFSKPYADLEGEGMSDPTGYMSRVFSKREEMAALWNRECHNVKSEMIDSGLGGYTEKGVAKFVAGLENFLFDNEYSTDSFKYLEKFISRNVYDPQNLNKNATKLPNHDFFDLCDEYYELIQNIDKIKTTLIQEAIKGIKNIRKKLSINSNAITYDDLLNRVERALTHLDNGEKLGKILNKKYPFALVDEFQDTDPIQYSILKSIYQSQKTDSSLVMIGDPKQAIYAFRGADVYTYIKARDESSVQQYTLHKNFRSTPSFNNAVNTLFGISDHPFIDNEIGYRDVDAGLPDLEDDFLIHGNRASGIRFITKPGIDSNKNDSRKFAFSHTAGEISKLVQEAENGEVLIKGRKLEAGDIAVLVSSHREAEEIKQRLKKLGIDSVTYSREKVFESPEAKRLESVMAAILDPYNRTAVNDALISGFWGQNLNYIYELSTEGEERQELIEDLQELAEVWLRDGFYPMFRKLLFTGERIAKLAQFSNSERLLTNLYQLADICAKAEKEGKLDPNSLHSWFVDEMVDPDKDDEKTLLLESDQNLVKISTIHNSKGLEFPVVFCPTLWGVLGGNNKDLLIEYHNEKNDPVILCDQQNGEKRDLAKYQSNLENTAEEIRKYYVAVTRAKYLCVIPWTNHNASLRSGLASSLMEAESQPEIIKNSMKLKSNTDFTDETILNLFIELEQKSNGAIELIIKEEDEIGQGSPQPFKESSEQLQVSGYKGRKALDVQRRVESFSSLTSHNAESGEPDYDQVMESYFTAINKEKKDIRDLNIFTFPRGATAGTAIHKLFEDKKFRFDTALHDDHDLIIEKVLDQYQIDQKWKKVTQNMIRNVVSAEIPGLNLGEVKEDEQLREMEFHFKAQQSSLENILKIIRSEGGVQHASKNDLQSFLTGFIDLIVRQNGKYFIVDYKSNYLGDTLEDYGQERLKEEIYNASYDLQYHLYTVALVKYLKSRIRGFNYEKDFGGVAYLFVRGMRRGEGNGVWFHKPDAAVMERLMNELEVRR